MMKKILSLFLATFLSVVMQAQSQVKDPYLTKSFTSGSIKDLYVRTSGGSITVAGETGEARVEVYITGNNGKTLSEKEIKQRLDEDYKLNVAVEGSKLIVTAEPKDKNFNWKQALTISFNIVVSRNVSTDLSTSGGKISLSNLSGSQNFSTSGGSLHLDRLSGKIKGRTSGGSIEVKNSKDNIDLNTSGGSIEAENCSGILTLSTSGGPIRLNDLEGKVKANTSGGPIRGRNIKGELSAHTSGGGINLQDMACSIDAATSGGSIDIGINQLAEYITVNNSGGSIHVKLPADKGVDLKLRGNRINIDNMNNFSGSKDEHKVEGKLNGGGVPVNIKTSGKITIAFY